MQNNKLIFVYNADSGFFNTVSDIAHKITSPETYQCKLCALTHGYFKVKDAWQEFLIDRSQEFVFFHRDEFIEQYGQPVTLLPAVFIGKPDGLEVFIDKQKLDSLESIEQLMALIDESYS